MLRRFMQRRYGHRKAGEAIGITPQAFLDLGVRGVVVDLDNTLVRWHGEEIVVELAQWVASLKAAGLKVLILSNTTRGERLARIAGTLEVEHIPCGIIPVSLNLRGFGAKPSRQAFSKAARQLGLPPEQLAMVGDQLFTDILGANRAGYRAAFLVSPMDRQEHWGTRAKRPFERYLLKLLGRWE